MEAGRNFWGCGRERPSNLSQKQFSRSSVPRWSRDSVFGPPSDLVQGSRYHLVEFLGSQMWPGRPGHAHSPAAARHQAADPVTLSCSSSSIFKKIFAIMNRTLIFQCIFLTFFRQQSKKQFRNLDFYLVALLNFLFSMQSLWAAMTKYSRQLINNKNLFPIVLEAGSVIRFG